MRQKLKVGRVFKQATGYQVTITNRLDKLIFLGKSETGELLKYWDTGKPYYNGTEFERFSFGTNRYLLDVENRADKYLCSYCMKYHKKGFECGFYPGWEYD